MSSSPAPGWYPDQSGTTRYWDGQQWTTATAPATGAPPPPPGLPAIGLHGGSSANAGERRFTIHYGFALLAFFALLGTVFPCLFLFLGTANSEDPNGAGFGLTFAVMWGLWGGMWVLIWSAFAIHHTLKSRT